MPSNCIKCTKNPGLLQSIIVFLIFGDASKKHDIRKLVAEFESHGVNSLNLLEEFEGKCKQTFYTIKNNEHLFNSRHKDH